MRKKGQTSSKSTIIPLSKPTTIPTQFSFQKLFPVFSTDRHSFSVWMSLKSGFLRAAARFFAAIIKRRLKRFTRDCLFPKGECDDDVPHIGSTISMEQRKSEPVWRFVFKVAGARLRRSDAEAERTCLPLYRCSNIRGLQT